jgi:magnesium transporter
MDDLADIVPDLPESALHNLLLTLDHKHRDHLKHVLSYPEDSDGLQRFINQRLNILLCFVC